VDERVRSKLDQLANRDSGAAAMIATRRTLCVHLGHTHDVISESMNQLSMV
jgi:hypothetical protein